MATISNTQAAIDRFLARGGVIKKVTGRNYSERDMNSAIRGDNIVTAEIAALDKFDEIPMEQFSIGVRVDYNADGEKYTMLTA